METLKNFLQPLGVNAGSLQDTLKLVVIGGTVETARRASVSAWNGFVDSFFLTATFNQGDVTYDWIMYWLSKQPAWGRSREFEITTRAVSRNGLSQSTSGDVEEDEVEEEDDDVGRRKRKVAFLPSVDTTHTIYYRGHVLRITRSKSYKDYGHYSSLKISVVARNNDVLKKLVLEAKREYEKDAEHRVHIFMADTTYACWRWNGSRQKRPMSSIVLEPSVKEMILMDCKDFLRSEDWYAERGIPFRRGYLLHGVPGSGKTSLIHSLAGELNLDIYVVSLSSKGMSDNTLTTLMGMVPARCILLLEDLDAAFTRSVSRDSSSTGTPTALTKVASEAPDGSTLSLSGLLNSLDGVAAAEGRLLFATTNHIERLDPALSRPGRMDVWVNFTNATRWQAEGIFKNFFPSKSSKPGSPDTAELSQPGAIEKDRTEVSDSDNYSHKPKALSHAVPLLDDSEIAELAKRFASAIPEDEMSVASLQGYLLKNKTRPRECVEEAAAWVQQERTTREKLKKEKEEREAKEKREAEEAARKEKEDAENAERAEREAKDKAERKEMRRKARKLRIDASNISVPTPTPPPPPPSVSAPLPPPQYMLGAQGGSGNGYDSSSESEGDDEVTTANEADAEESVTSEGESTTGSRPASGVPLAKEKWVAVKTTSSEPSQAPAPLSVHVAVP